MIKFKSKKKLMAKDGYICIRGYIVPTQLKGVRKKDRFVSFIRDAKMISIEDLKKRKEWGMLK